jgi:hypothetical protein
MILPVSPASHDVVLGLTGYPRRRIISSFPRALRTPPRTQTCIPGLGLDLGTMWEWRVFLRVALCKKQKTQNKKQNNKKQKTSSLYSI